VHTATTENPDFIFPMCMDIFYPIVEQGSLGNVKKQWVHDRTVACSLSPAGSAFKEEVTPTVNIKQELLIIGRLKTDIRISSRDNNNAITNVITSNIKDRSGRSIYNETAGPRSGKPTIFEVATIEPFVGPFGSIEYYKIVLRRSENQAVDI
jgi:hypothetical protein